MNTQHLSMLAGVMSTGIFTLSHIPMLIRAYRTRDLRSYSPANLVLSNLGNAIHWLYIVNLPFGPIWFLHSFYTIVTGLMLFWYLRYRRPAGTQAPPPRGQRAAPAGHDLWRVIRPTSSLPATRATYEAVRDGMTAGHDAPSAGAAARLVIRRPHPPPVEPSPATAPGEGEPRPTALPRHTGRV